MSDDRVHRRTGGGGVKADITELLASVRSRMMSIDEARAVLLGDTMPSADAALIDRLHTAEAEVAILRSFKAGVPWESLYRVAQYEEEGQWSAHNECVQAWIAANHPQEATE